MIEADAVKTLIVKDMSRLGREYFQVSRLAELYLPTKGVRFIAINDGVDSLEERGAGGALSYRNQDVPEPGLLLRSGDAEGHHHSKSASLG